MKGDMTWTTVEIISVAAALVIMLLIVWPAMKEALFNTGQQGQCNWSFMISKFGAKILQDIPPECEANRITIDNSMLNSRLSAAEKAVKEYKKNLNSPESQFFNDRNLPEWALNSIVADELVDCSDKVLRGKLDLFSGNYFTSKTACVICSRIRFAKDLPLSLMNLKSGYIDSLNLWLKINNFKGQSYYEHIGVNKKDTPAFVYSPRFDYAVVYWELNPSNIEWYAGYLQSNPKIARGIATVTVAIGAVSLLTPVGWTLGLIALAGSASTGIYAGAEAGTYISRVALGTEIELGITNRALILTPYDESLITPFDKGGIGCEQIID